MRVIGCLIACLVTTLQSFAQSAPLLDGVWCSRGEKNIIQWEYEAEGQVLKKDQFCVILKVSKTSKGVAVGRAITQYLRVENLPDHAAVHSHEEMFYDASLFAFAEQRGGYRLAIIDATDKTSFDLVMDGEDVLQGFIQEIGSNKKYTSRNAFAGHVQLQRIGQLPADFDERWVSLDEKSH